MSDKILKRKVTLISLVQEPVELGLRYLSSVLKQHGYSVNKLFLRLRMTTDIPKAERHIRPNVIFRKITFGNRSTEGTLNHSVLMSVLQTAKLNKLHPLRTFKKIFTLPKGKITADLLIPP